MVAAADGADFGLPVAGGGVVLAGEEGVEWEERRCDGCCCKEGKEGGGCDGDVHCGGCY